MVDWCQEVGDRVLPPAHGSGQVLGTWCLGQQQCPSGWLGVSGACTHPGLAEHGGSSLHQLPWISALERKTDWLALAHTPRCALGKHKQYCIQLTWNSMIPWELATQNPVAYKMLGSSRDIAKQSQPCEYVCGLVHACKQVCRCACVRAWVPASMHEWVGASMCEWVGVYVGACVCR